MKIKMHDVNGNKNNIGENKTKLIAKFSQLDHNWQTKKKTQKLMLTTDNIEGTHYHSNYLEYLEICWANHYGIRITPDIIWHTLLGELVNIVKSKPEEYAKLFTKTPEKKQEILISSDDLVVMPLDKLIEFLEEVVPAETYKFMPDFSTTNKRSLMARYAAFADLVSPYYNYGILCCGIPFVDVQGTKDDWNKVANSWVVLKEYFPNHIEYMNSVENLLKSIVSEMESSSFWADMFRLERCGSGSQVVVKGWWSKLYSNAPALAFITNFNTHVAKVSYKSLPLDKEFEMYHSIFSSRLEDEMLIPEFGSMVFEKLKEPLINDYDPYKSYNIEDVTVYPINNKLKEQWTFIGSK